MAGRDRHLATGAALLEWINSIPISERADSLNDLNDGHKIWAVLRDIDPEYFENDLPEGPSSSGKWLSRWQNLKQISKALISYVADECGQKVPTGSGAGDLKLIAMDGSPAETIKLLKLVLVAAISSPKAANYIQTMPTLSTATQSSLKDLIEELQSPSPAPSDAEIGQKDAPKASRKTLADPELVFEERFGKVMADNEKLARERKELQRGLRDLHNRLARLQENNAVLQSRLAEAEDQLQQKSGSNGESYVKGLESRLQQQEDLIATQEGQLSDYQIGMEKLRKSADKYRGAHEKFQALQDKVDEIRTERDSFARKANTIDKYKQKLKTAQNLEKENQTLCGELDETRQLLREAQQASQQVAGLEKTIEEYKRILPKIEEDRHVAQMMKQQLEFDNAALAKRCEQARETHTKDKETITDLLDKTRAPESPSSTAIGARGGLQNEIEDSQIHEIEMNHDLKEKVEYFTKTAHDAEAKTVVLRHQLEDLEQKYSILDKKYQEVYQDRMVLESAVTKVKGDSPTELTEAFQEMRDQIVATHAWTAQLETENVALKQQLGGVQSNSEKSQDSIIGLYADAAEVPTGNGDTLQGIEHLRKVTSLELNSLHKENLSLTLKIRNLEQVLKSHKIMLQKASEGKQLSASEMELSNQELKETLDQIRATTLGRVPSRELIANDTLDRHISDLADIIKDGRERVAKKTQQIEQQDLEIKVLRDRLAEIESERLEDPSDQAVLEQELENVKRENRLMATAFHNLSSRLQMSSVTLLRRNDDPLGFLNRQRLKVNQATAVRQR